MKLLSFIAMIFILFGCGKNSNTDSSPHPTVSTTKEEDHCINVFFNNNTPSTFSELAQATYKVTKECSVNIENVIPYIENLKGINYE